MSGEALKEGGFGWRGLKRGTMSGEALKEGDYCMTRSLQS